jgi:benzoyl-CoA reductase subunit A
MKCTIGIDLGSTTTKAVVLDMQENVLGRGITNSRSNYDVACDVARTEALLDARFNLFRSGIVGFQQIVGDVDAFTEALRQGFRLQQHLETLRELESTCGHLAGILFTGQELEKVKALYDGVFGAMVIEAEQLFAIDAKRRSDFFRDIAGSSYMKLVDLAAADAGLSFERLLGVYDKAILLVEAHVFKVDLTKVLGLSLRRALDSAGVAQEAHAEFFDVVHHVATVDLDLVVTVGTGYGRARLPFPKEWIRSEILCHGLGAHATFPNTRTVLDIGGQDTKAIQVDGDGIVTSFQMNDRCAAGCGRYLGYIADEMNLGLHELGPLAQTSTSTVKINSTCTVFAGAELRDRLAAGQKREDILAGLHRAIILRAMSLLARSGGIDNEFTFTGGVANNAAAVDALRKLVEENYGEITLNISPSSIYTGAHGAAIFAVREALHPTVLDRVSDKTNEAVLAGGTL